MLVGDALQSQDPWRVRIMPRVAFGLHPSSAEAGGTGRPPLKEVVVVHHAQGRWQEEVPWSELLLPRKVLRMVAPWALAARWAHRQSSGLCSSSVFAFV